MFLDLPCEDGCCAMNGVASERFLYRWDTRALIFQVDRPKRGARPEVAKALLHAFVNKLGQSAIPNSPPAFSPWKLTTGDKDPASAVSDEFKRTGVRPLELCKIRLSKPQTNSIMQEAYTRLFATVKMAAGYTGIAAAAIKTARLKFSGTSSSNLIP